jgi:hypothetical protein
VAFETPEPEVEKLRTENAALRKEVEVLKVELANFKEAELEEICCADAEYKGKDGFCRDIEGKCDDDRCPKWQPTRGKD